MSLVPVARYQSWTGDTATTTDRVAQALADAEQLIAEHIGRAFGTVAVTETLTVSRNGLLYPTRTPVTAVATEGWRLVSGVVFACDGLAAPGERVEVTYTAGWTTETLPLALVGEVCDVAFQLSRPAAVRATAGAAAVSNGDVSISYGGARPVGNRLDLVCPGATVRLRPWRWDAGPS